MDNKAIEIVTNYINEHLDKSGTLTLIKSSKIRLSQSESYSLENRLYQI